ncbi:MAG TPA: RNA-binding cell elongation regulator Jag/EloR [Candidatus Limnocylindrales bacterium]|nr:RNA-binding cell elongation regulator Jag/EloR [Candidatus Limnocylindrales bacterium]
MSEYQEFTGKSVEEAIKAACDAFGVGLGDLDFEILTPGSRGVLGMGAEPARIVAAPRSALGGSAPKREAAESKPLPPPPAGDRDRGPRRDYGDRPAGDRPAGDRDRGPRRDYGDRPAGDRPPRRDVGDRPASDRPVADPAAAGRPAGDRPTGDRGPRREYGDRPAGDRPPRRDDRGPRRDDRGPRREGAPSRGGSELSAAEVAAVATARGSLAMERAELEAAEATPEALAAGREILETVMRHLGFAGVTVEIREGETSRLNVVGDGPDREALGSLIGRKGERLSALQHLVNLMLSRRTGQWTRVLVDVEDYRGRRERQLIDLAARAADRVGETGKMLQLEPMPALERRWIHLALRDNDAVSTQSIGEEPNRRVVVLPRNP